MVIEDERAKAGAEKRLIQEVTGLLKTPKVNIENRDPSVRCEESPDEEEIASTLATDVRERWWRWSSRSCGSRQTVITKEGRWHFEGDSLPRNGGHQVEVSIA